MKTGPVIAFATRNHEQPALEVRINFGILAGREATAAEIDDLAAALLPLVGDVSIVSEERHEIGEGSEAVLHQVRVEVAADRVPADEAELDSLEQRLIEEAVRWTDTCVAQRHVGLG